MTPAETFNDWVNGLSTLEACVLVALWAVSCLALAYWLERKETR